MKLNLSEKEQLPGPFEQSISSKLSDALQPEHLEVLNESHMHKVAPGSETHFRVVVVSERFRGESRVGRHRMINALLNEELSQGVHALAIETYVSEQWQAREEKRQQSPKCRGGSN